MIHKFKFVDSEGTDRLSLECSDPDYWLVTVVVDGKAFSSTVFVYKDSSALGRILGNLATLDDELQWVSVEKDLLLRFTKSAAGRAMVSVELEGGVDQYWKVTTKFQLVGDFGNIHAEYMKFYEQSEGKI